MATWSRSPGLIVIANTVIVIFVARMFSPILIAPGVALDFRDGATGEEIIGQIYNFIDKGERAVALRPEMTPTLARMVAARERNYKKPFKWFAIPQLFRYERQQRGRLRSFYQFNADIFGEPGPEADQQQPPEESLLEHRRHHDRRGRHWNSLNNHRTHLRRAPRRPRRVNARPSNEENLSVPSKHLRRCP